MSATGLGRAEVEALFVRLERPLYNVLLRRIWNPADAAELCQETFARLWQAREGVRPETAEAYTWRLALNLASKRRRWARIRAFVGLDERLATETPSPEQQELSRDLGRALQTALEALPPGLRDTLLLCEFSELSHAAVAEVLGIAPGTVGSRRHTALAQLRSHLGGDHAV